MGDGDYLLPLLSRLRTRGNTLLLQRNGYNLAFFTHNLAFFTSKPLEISLIFACVLLYSHHDPVHLAGCLGRERNVRADSRGI